jgi:hypothetical protein
MDKFLTTSVIYDLCGYTANNCVIRNIAGNNRVGPDHYIVSNSYRTDDLSPRTEIYTIANLREPPPRCQ